MKTSHACLIVWVLSGGAFSCASNDGEGAPGDVGVDSDGDGIVDGVGVDIDGDGVVDGIDVDGDGIVDHDGTGGNANGGGSNNGQTGGNNGQTDGPQDDACGADVTPLGMGRCASGLVTAKGSALMLHDFDEAGSDNDYLGLFFADGRAGKWWEAHFPDNGGMATMAVEPTSGPGPGGERSLHYFGSAPGGWGATIGVPMADCYDASIHKGISFSIKGDPSAGNQWVKFSLHTPVSEPEPAGGCSAADEAAGKCRDHFATAIPVTGTWTRHNIAWSDFNQNCPSNVEPGFAPEKQILTISFSILDREAGFDFWLDDISFDIGSEPSSGFSDIVSKATFEELWVQHKSDGSSEDLRDPFYTYEGLVNAADQYGGAFCTGSDAVANRREAAAFLANVAHESDSLGLVRETSCQNGSCEYGQYYGRGPIQLTWQNNYAAAGNFLGIDLQGSNAEKVATDVNVAFGSAMWFWMQSTGAGATTPHNAIQSGTFGDTIRAINGALECNGGNTAAINTRIRHYERICNYLGVDPGTGKGC